MEEKQINNRESILWTISIPQVILIIISMIWIYFDTGINIASKFNFNYKILILGIIIGGGLSASGYGFYRLMKHYKNISSFSSIVNFFEQYLSPAFQNLKSIDFIVLSIISGFTEEIFFRGLLLQRTGIIISSLAFGALHLPGFKLWIYAIWAFLSGVFFCYLYIFSGSLWLPIIAHTVNNIIGMFMLKRMGDK